MRHAPYARLRTNGILTLIRICYRIGPRDLTEGTVEGKELIDTVTDALFSQGIITNNIVSVYFEPNVEVGNMNGELSFGGVDNTKIIGDVKYASISEFSLCIPQWDSKVLIMNALQPQRNLRMSSGASIKPSPMVQAIPF